MYPYAGITIITYSFLIYIDRYQLMDLINETNKTWHFLLINKLIFYDFELEFIDFYFEKKFIQNNRRALTSIPLILKFGHIFFIPISTYFEIFIKKLFKIF